MAALPVMTLEDFVITVFCTETVFRLTCLAEGAGADANAPPR